MKLFELHAEPSEVEGAMIFSLIPTEELKNELDDDWLKQLGDIVADDFIEAINRHANGEEINDSIGMFKITSKLSNDGTITMENTGLEVINNLVSKFDDGECKAFDIITKQFSEKMTELITDYTNSIFSISAASGENR